MKMGCRHANTGKQSDITFKVSDDLQMQKAVQNTPKYKIPVTHLAKRTIFNRTAVILSFMTHHPDSHHLQCLRMKSASFGARFTQTTRKKHHSLLLRCSDGTCTDWQRRFQGKKCILRGLDTSDIVLWKVRIS